MTLLQNWSPILYDTVTLYYENITKSLQFNYIYLKNLVKRNIVKYNKNSGKWRLGKN